MNDPSRVPKLAVVTLCLAIAFLSLLPAAARGSEDDDMDKLLAPIALYPDGLLAQVLTAATSPDQVKEFHDWLGQQKATGSDLQQAAMDAKFDAAFASLAIFPDVIKLLADNMDWTKEIGTAYLSSKDKVSASVQRLRAQAKTQGNLKSNEQQKVTVDNEGGSQTIIIEPANPQVVYVPQYDPVVVYTEPPPSDNSGDAAMAALIGFGLGIAIGAAMDNDYYGYGAWGWGWHGGGVYYHRAAWAVPVRPRYPYARPMPGYRPNRAVVAPRHTNVNINVDNSRTNAGNRVNTGDVNRDVNRDGNRGDRNKGDASRGNLDGTSRSKDTASSTARGRSSSSNAGRSESSAFGGYSSRSSTDASSSRGRSSVASSKGSHGGGGGRSGGSRGGGGRR